MNYVDGHYTDESGEVHEYSRMGPILIILTLGIGALIVYPFVTDFVLVAGVAFFLFSALIPWQTFHITSSYLPIIISLGLGIVLGVLTFWAVWAHRIPVIIGAVFWTIASAGCAIYGIYLFSQNKGEWGGVTFIILAILFALFIFGHIRYLKKAF